MNAGDCLMLVDGYDDSPDPVTITCVCRWCGETVSSRTVPAGGSPTIGPDALADAEKARAHRCAVIRARESAETN